MTGYLERRGTRVEPLVAWLDRGHRQMALLPMIAFADAQLPADDDGFVRCRLGGLPALLAPVTSTIRVDLVSLSTLWPRWASELFALAGEEAARAIVAGELIFEPTMTSERVEALILEHQIRAENLYLLGQQPSDEVPTVDALTLRWPSGTLGIALDAEAFERALATQDLAPDAGARVTWNDVPVVLPTATLAWHDEELAELAILVSMEMQTGAAEEVLHLLETALPDRGEALPANLVLASILNVWGAALRQRGDLPDAITMLDRARTMGRELDPQLAQQTAYNLGYAKLQTTMKSRVGGGKKGGAEVVHATYDIDPAHRPLWYECLALFEEALALAPEDATARAQRDQVRKLLALLDGAPPAAKAERREPEVADEPSKWNWVPLVIFVAIAIAGALYLHGERERAMQQAAPPISVDDAGVGAVRAP